MRLAFAAMLLLCTCQEGLARSPFHLRVPRRGPAITLRRRLHVNSLITDPGTVEVEWNNTFDISSDWDWTMPSTVKYTPEGPSLFWGRTEYSASFDGVQRDRVGFAANTLMFDGEHFDAAIQPQATFLFNGDTGARLGATAIGRFDWSRNSAGMTLSWSGATAKSPTNPAGVLDLVTGIGRHLADRGLLGHVTAHVDMQVEKQTGVGRTLSLFEGFEYQVNERIAVDFSGQHYNVHGGVIDHELVIGLTANLGHIFRH